MSDESILTRLFPKEVTKGERAKLRIINATVEAIGKEGAHQITFDSIGKRLGIEKAQVRYHFPDKEILLFKTVETVLYIGQETFMQHLTCAKPGIPQVIAIIDGLFDWFHRYPLHRSVYLYFFYQASRDSKYRALHDQMLNAGFARMLACLQNIPPGKQAMSANERNRKMAVLSQSLWANSLGFLIYSASSGHSSLNKFHAQAIASASPLMRGL